MRFFILGTGYTGDRMARLLVPRSEHTVAGTRRRVGDVAGEVPLFPYDLAEPPEIRRILSELGWDRGEPVHLVFTAGPPRLDDRSDSLGLLEGFLDELPGERLGGFTFLSSTSVYGDAGGDWVDETDPPDPVSRSGRLKTDAENLLADALPGDVPLLRARPGGIYGPERNGFRRYLSEDYELVEGGEQWTNRIHVEDLARSLIHLAERGADGIYNVVDGNPVRLGDLVRFVHERAGRDPSNIPSIPWEEAERTYSEMKLGLLKPDKRVSARKLKSTGYEFRYPTVYEGLDDFPVPPVDGGRRDD